MLRLSYENSYVKFDAYPDEIARLFSLQKGGAQKRKEKLHLPPKYYIHEKVIERKFLQYTEYACASN